MLNLFLSVFFSSAAMTSVFLMYFIAEFLLRERFNHRTKAIALKIAIFLQPIFVLLAMLILLSGADFRENSALKDLLGTNSSYGSTADVFESLAVPMSSLSEGKGGEMIEKALETANHGSEIDIATFEAKNRFRFDFSALTAPMTYAAHAWFLVALALLIRRSIIYFRFKKHITKDCLREEDREVLCGAKTKIYRSKTAGSPFLIGCLRPFIVLPEVDMDDFELSLVLRHECIHLKNRDIPFKFALELLKCLNWFNPLIGAVQKKYNLISEFLVDEIVTERLSTPQRKAYGQLLLKFSEHNIKKRLAAFSYLSEEAKHLADRLEFIMKRKDNKKINRIIVAFTIAVVATTVSAGAYITSGAFVYTPRLQSHASETLAFGQTESYFAQMESHFGQMESHFAQTAGDSTRDIGRSIGRLIYDDGKVQIFDGPADEDISIGLADMGDGDGITEARQTVLETGEYRARAVAGDDVRSLGSGTVVSSKYEQGYGYCVTVEDEEGRFGSMHIAANFSSIAASASPKAMFSPLQATRDIPNMTWCSFVEFKTKSNKIFNNKIFNNKIFLMHKCDETSPYFIRFYSFGSSRVFYTKKASLRF